MESFTLGLMRGDGAPLYRQLYLSLIHIEMCIRDRHRC